MSCCYKESLKDLVNSKVVIHSGRCCYHVIICEICACYIKAIELGTGNVRNFNMDRIDYIEDYIA